MISLNSLNWNFNDEMKVIIMRKIQTLDRRWTDDRLKFCVVLITLMIKTIGASTILNQSLNNFESIPNEDKCSQITVIEQCPDLKYNFTASPMFSHLQGTFMDFSQASEVVKLICFLFLLVFAISDFQADILYQHT